MTLLDMTPGQRLRELLAREAPVVKPGVHDALGAMLVERAGFHAVGVSGYGCAASLFAKPDIGLTTLTDMVSTAARIAGAVDIPVIADADTGYGNAIGVMWTVEQFIRAGVAAIHVEDQVAPKRCGHVAGKEVLPLQEAVGKIRAAHDVRQRLDPSFVIIARTDARGAAGGSVAEAIRRGLAYAEAGADMIFPDAVLDESELEEYASKFPVPMHYNRSLLSPRLSLSRLRELRVAIVSNPDAELLPMVIAVWDYLTAFRERDVDFQTAYEESAQTHPMADLHALLGLAEIRRYEDEYLPPAYTHDKYKESIGYPITQAPEVDHADA